MTQTEHDIEQQREWLSGAWKILVIVVVLLAVSPFLIPGDDVLSLVRYAVKTVVIGLICSVMLARAYVWLDQVFPGSMSEKIGENPYATAMLACTFLGAVAYILACA